MPKTNRTHALILLAAIVTAKAPAQQVGPPRLDPRALSSVAADDESSVLRNARDALVQANDFAAALGPAEEIVAAAPERIDAVHRMDLIRLARIQAELEMFDDAESNYLTAIELVEDADGETSATLIEPYQGLGRTYLGARRFVEAVTVFEHARDISQRNAGLFNVEQTALIDDITMAQLGLGNTVEARDLQLERLDNAVRRFGADDPRVIPFHHRLAEYYDSSRMRLSAREQYEHILEIQESQLAPTDPRLLGTLRELARIELLLGDDDEAKLRVVEVLDSNPDLASVERGLSLALLGDWAIVEEDFVLAADYYARAYSALEAADGVDRDEVLSRPSMIDFFPPLTSVDRGRRSDPWAWGSIELEFDLSAEGRASNVRIVAANPPGLVESSYHRRLRETHFRPHLIAGIPAPIANVQFTHFFRFYVED